MSAIGSSHRREAGLLVLLAAVSGWPAAAQQFQVVNRTLVSSNRSNRTEFYYTYRADACNRAAAATEVRTTVTSSSPNSRIIDGELEFGDIAAGQCVSSIDTFTIGQDRDIPLDPAVLSFHFRSRENLPPVARAGGDKLVAAAFPATVQLDGSGSYDPDGSIAAYLWKYIDPTPPGLPPPLISGATVNPTVTIGASGCYRFRLTVMDNAGLASAPADVKVCTGPVANAGPHQAVKAGDTVHLDGSGSSDPDGRALTFAWSLAVPSGSSAKLSDPSIPKPTFVADVADGYTATLKVNNGLATSAPGTVRVHAFKNLIMCGDLVSGSIDQPAQVNQYWIDSQADAVVTITLVDTGGFNHYYNSSQATLFAPSGGVVKKFGANSQQQITMPETGAYLLQMQSSDLVTKGTYIVGLVCRSPKPSPVITTLGCGALQSGNIASPAQVDQYTLTGQANAIVTLTLADTSGFNHYYNSSQVTLFAPSGVVVKTFGANSQQQITLPETGTYLLQVQSSDLVTTGKYILGVVCRSPTPAPVIAALGCGALQSGSIASPAQVDQYTLTGQANAVVTLTLADTSGFNHYYNSSQVTLFAPSGKVVKTFGANSQQQITLPETGTYLFQVQSSDLVTIGKYILGVVCRSPTPEPVITTLGCGALQSGSIVSPAQVDQYTLAGQANAVVTLTLVDTSGFNHYYNSSYVTLFAPSGAVVKEFGANSQLQITLPETGTYLLQVRSSDLVTIGKYILGVVCRSPTPSPVIGPLGCGALQSGSIASAAQVDQYTLTGQANAVVTMTLVDTSGFNHYYNSSYVTLFAPSGVVVKEFGANSQLQITLPETGTYLLQVRSSDLVTIGKYILGVVCRSPTSSPVIAPLGCGALQAGSIASPAQVDQYTLTGQANAVVTMTLADTSGFNHYYNSSYVTLFAPSGVVVKAFAANSQQQITLPETGTYLLQVRSSDLVTIGKYILGVVCRSPTPSPVIAVLGCGALQSGSIASPAQVDQYTLTGQANAVVTMTLADTSGFNHYYNSSYVTLFAPSGVVVKEFGANSQQQITLPETGTYLLQVRSSDLVTIGKYILGLVCRSPTPAPIVSALVCGPPQSGTIASPAQVNQYTFNGQANAVVTLTQADTSGFNHYYNASQVTLFAPSGAKVPPTPIIANSQQQYTLPETGTYLLQVQSSDLVTIGTYNTAFVCQ